MTGSDLTPWRCFGTQDVDEAHAHLSANYMEIRVRQVVPGERFSLTTRIAALGDVILSQAGYEARTRLFTVPFADPCFVHLTGGAYRVVGRGEDYAATVGSTLLLLPQRRLDVRVDDFRLNTVTLPYELVQEVAQLRTGIAPGVPVRFESARPVSKSSEQHWLNSIAYVRHAILSHPALASSPLIVGEARRVLAAAALTAFPNTTMHEVGGELSGGVGRSTVRRAISFIEANPARDVSTVELAAAARVAVPALVRAFRTYLGTTPRAYLRRTRLELVHRDLGEADVGSVSVAEVARRWGFLNERRFTAEYRRAFGRYPAETLRS